MNSVSWTVIWLFRLFCISWILAVCGFQGSGPFLLHCLINKHKIVHGISLLSFYWLQKSVVILFKQVNFAKVKCTDLGSTLSWVLTNIYTRLTIAQMKMKNIFPHSWKFTWLPCQSESRTPSECIVKVSIMLEQGWQATTQTH